MANAVSKLASKYKQVLDAVFYEDYPLEYNQKIDRNYTFYARINGSSIYYSSVLDYKASV